MGPVTVKSRREHEQALVQKSLYLDYETLHQAAKLIGAEKPLREVVLTINGITLRFEPAHEYAGFVAVKP